MKFRKKPVVIEAWPVRDVIRDARSHWASLPTEVIAAYDAGKFLFLPRCIEIRTLEGTMTAEFNDWLIRGVKGEFYPCKPDVFAETYEPSESRSERDGGQG